MSNMRPIEPLGGRRRKNRWNETGWLLNESEFVVETIRQVMSEYTIDRQRVVAHGMGQGGQMAFYLGFNARDRDNLAIFVKEFDQYEANFDNPDPAKRLPNLITMGMGEDHTRGTQAGAFTPARLRRLPPDVLVPWCPSAS